MEASSRTKLRFLPKRPNKAQISQVPETPWPMLRREMASNPTPPCWSLLLAPAEGRPREGDGDAETLPDAEKGACVVVDVGCGGQGTDVGGSDREDEKVCRICHLSPAGGEEGSGLIQLGCGCKGELGVAHRHCAEEWFRLKGNRYCEICGVNAKNIAGEEGSRSMEERHVRREPSIPHSLESDERGGCWRRQSYCNFLMACFIIASIFLWFFRVSMF